MFASLLVPPAVALHLGTGPKQSGPIATVCREMVSTKWLVTPCGHGGQRLRRSPREAS